MRLLKASMALCCSFRRITCACTLSAVKTTQLCQEAGACSQMQTEQAGAAADTLAMQIMNLMIFR